MVHRDDLITHIDALLSSPPMPDYGPNGLQVEGGEQVHHIVCGVTACLELIEEAARRGAQALLVHHGILWGGVMPVITRSFRRRLKALLDADLNLVAYHLPLDRHLELGNGATVARRLALAEIEPFGAYKGSTIGVRGRLAVPTGIDALAERVRTALSTAPIVVPAGPTEIRTIGIVTGGAPKELAQAVDARLDCFITGEISEHVMHFAKEEGIHFIAAGHHATERYGIQALAEHLASTLPVTCEFVDIPNPA